MLRPSLRYRAALLAARGARSLSRLLLHRSGNVIGGAVLLRLAPGGVRALARSRRITIVSGTNGKSTTTAMITAALRAAGPVCTNDDGANTPHGLAWAVAAEPADEVVLEVDESWMPWAVRVLRPHTAVLLNLTRDQLHRKPEIGPLAESWRRAVRAVPRVVAVAHDPGGVRGAQEAPRAEHLLTRADWVMVS
ncbi:MAG: Mur ligase family protein, partial [Marmoricola sp.]